MALYFYRAFSREGKKVSGYLDASSTAAVKEHLTKQGFYDEEHAHASFIQGGGHGGSYPHLVHEFISAIVEERTSAIDVETAANWTMVGLCAHESAMQDGKRINVPHKG